MKKFLYSLSLAALIIFSTSSSCKKDPTPTPTPKPQGTLVVMPLSLTFAPEGGSQNLTLNASEEWTATCPEWVTLNPASGAGESKTIKLAVTVAASTEAERKGEITVSLKSGKSEKIAVTQQSGETTYTSLEGKKILIAGNSMVYYGGCVINGNQKSSDTGLLYQLIRAYGETATVYDCTFGGHALHDFTEKGCTSSNLHGDSGTSSSGNCPGVGTELLIPNLASVDYLFISEAGNNNSAFYTDATAIFNRVKAANPNVKCFYINHIYSVYKGHTSVTSQLKNLHDRDGVTIINCGQLAYDIYTGKLKVPGGSMTYSDRYTFCNHTSSDTHHPNPLMGYIMAQMCYCALTGRDAYYEDYAKMVKGSTYGGGGSVTYGNYYSKYYTTAAAHPFMDVIDNAAEIKGIQQLIPTYIDKY